MTKEMKDFSYGNNVLKELDVTPQNAADAFETILTHVGDMGRYQRILFFLMFPIGVFFAFTYAVQMFIAVTPQRHWCRVPELAHLDMELRRNLTAPGAASGDWDRCSTFDVNWTQVLDSFVPPSPDTPTIPCQHGWEFELTDIPYETVVSERGWVCQNAGHVPMAQALFFLGSFTGGLLFGWIADHFGRVPALIGTNMVSGIGGIATIFTTTAWDFALCRFIAGMGFDNCFMMAYILVLEYVGPRHRTWVASFATALFFGSGCVVLPWLVLWIKDWRTLLWVTATPLLAIVFAPLIIPESARWYVSRGRVKDAVKVLRKFERINGTKLPDQVMNHFIVTSSQTEEAHDSLLVLFKRPLLRRTMVCSLVVFMATALLFDGIVRMSDGFGLDFFITFSVISFTEVPSVSLLAFILDRWGRRNLTSGPMSLAGLLMIAAIFVPKGMPQAALAVAARFGVSMAFSVIMQWSTEMLPTGVRASGSSALHMSGFVVTILSPYVVYSERLWSSMPLLILGTVALLGAAASLVLPETKGLPMPQTMTESEGLIRENTLWKRKRKREAILGLPPNETDAKLDNSGRTTQTLQADTSSG